MSDRRIRRSMALQNPLTSVTMPDLQPELIGEILSRLPVKSLLQFRCVSKLWRTLIDSQHFIKTHINRSIQSGKNQTLILTDLHSDLLYSVNFDSLDQAVELDYPVKYYPVELGVTLSSDPTRVGPLPVVVRRRSQVPEQRRRRVRGSERDRHGSNQVWGCCNGLILLNQCLWNPAIRKHRLIPEMKAKKVTFVITRGFGYDPVTDDYKIVNIVKNSMSVLHDMEVAFWVYSLKSNSWREIPDFPSKIEWVSEPERRKVPSSLYPRMDLGVFVGAALHWLVKGKFGVGGENDYIMAFDLRTEEYRMLSQPKCMDTHSFSNLGVIKGHLCIICSYCPIGYDIWLMEEYGVEQSWTRMTLQKEAFISYPGGLTKAYARDGEKVLLVQCTNGLRWYGLESMIMEDVLIANKPHAHETNVCLSSLVPLDEDD